MSRQELHERVENDLTLHPPKHPHIGELMDELRVEAKSFSHTLIANCPEGRELSQALTAVDDALKHGVAAIARNQDRVLQEAHVEFGGEASNLDG